MNGARVREPARSTSLRRVAFATLGLLSGALIATPSVATTMRRLDTRDLTLGSQDIVIGTVETVRPYWGARHDKIFTEVTVRVARSIKGAAVERLSLVQLGGEVDGVRYTVPGCAAFRPGEEALLFVWRDRRGQAQVNGLAQGKFDIERDATTGEARVQRRAPGMAVRDVRSLSALPEGVASPTLRLDDLVREIQRTLGTETER
jgi:hypothetical protein